MSQAIKAEAINPKATPLAPADLTKSILELIQRACNYKQLKRKFKTKPEQDKLTARFLLHSSTPVRHPNL